MSGDPALTKAIKKIAARLETGSYTIFTDRSDDEPVTPGERVGGAIVIRAVDVMLDERMEAGESTMVHAATIDFDHYADADSLDNIGFQHNVMIAESVGLINADWSHEGMFFEFTFHSITSAADVVPAVGVAILTAEVKFLTPFADWTVIVGQSGDIN